VIFVVDTCDAERFPLVRKELHGILIEEELANAVVLILANKTVIIKALELNVLDETKRKYHVQRTVATTGDGLRDGLTWLAKNMTPHVTK
jgi:ADP-ribosylation factor protein 6